MRSRPRLTYISVALAASIGGAALVRFVARLSSSTPTVWEDEIRAFEAQDWRNSPPSRPIVFAGSSSIRLWDTLAQDLAPLPVLNRGFGGAQIHQVTYYADRIVLPYAPRAVVFYAGENDIAGILFSRKKTPDDVYAAFQQFCDTLHAVDPELPIYFIAIKPPKRRRKFWPAMQRANELIQAYCASDARLHFIDVVSAMLDAQGQGRGDVFERDGIHLNKQGYAIWTTVIKPVLLEAFPTDIMQRQEIEPQRT